MSTHDLYAIPADMAGWDVAMSGSARFSWEYDAHRDRLLALYQKGKDKQWDATRRIDWDIPVDPYNSLGLPAEVDAPMSGMPAWERLSREERGEVARHETAWQFSQFMHGEQAAMICSARIVESVPDLDAKFYAATQTMDEARHAEIYARYLQEKLGLTYPINPSLKALLDDVLSDSRWDMPYLGMQVLIEGLALAAFGLLRDLVTTPLPRQILAYIMQDEARHVAFGRMALRDYYRELSAAERAEREDFVLEGCRLMRDRLRGEEIWETFGFDRRECMEFLEQSEYYRAYQSLLFTRIVPCIKDIGLWSDRIRSAYADMGILDFASADLDAMMRADEDIAEDVDRAKRFSVEAEKRAQEVRSAIAAGADTETGEGTDITA